MAQKQHYVSQFHLRNFLDPESVGAYDPWLWLGDIETGIVKRRAPKNFASSPGMFDGPGGFEDEHATIEKHLACEVEPAAAKAMWFVLKQPVGTSGELPPALSRYIAWAASRSLAWVELLKEWTDEFDPAEKIEVVEPPPIAFEKQKAKQRLLRMEHPQLGIREDVRTEEIHELRSLGWKWKLRRDDVLEMMHIQAYYFQVRFFPRLRWSVLWASKGKSFIIGDRPVIWGVDGMLHIPPSALRDPKAQLIAPLSHSVALFAEHTDSDRRSGIPIDDFNCWMAFAARQWIAGAAEGTVLAALSARRAHSKKRQDNKIE